MGLRRFGGCLVFMVVDGDRGSRHGQRIADCVTNAAVASGHDSHLVIEYSHGLFSSLSRGGRKVPLSALASDRTLVQNAGQAHLASLRRGRIFRVSY